MEIAGYTITRCLAQGGMAAAYLARHDALARTVVLKVLDTRANTSPVALQRFLAEGRLLATLQHPHVITLYDIGAVGDLAYLSMEYVSGGDLKQRLAEGPLAPDEALRILGQVAKGLGAAHAQGIVHRDVKPGNILFRADGTAVLSDFGIAKSLAGDANVTSSGVFVGSPNYMAPEQARQGEVDHRADIYALGVIFHEMLTGLKPYRADSVIEVIHRHSHAPVPRLPLALASFQGPLERMLAKDPLARFADVTQLVAAVAQAQRHWQTAREPAVTDAPQERPRQAPATRVASVLEQRLRWVLYAVLGLTLVGHAALFALGRQLATVPALPEAPKLPANDHGAPDQSAAVETLLQAAPTALVPVTGTERRGMARALLRLARQSYVRGHLTVPAAGSALYYFARALQLEPDNEEARAGIGLVAARYAQLGAQARRAGNPAQAEVYGRLAARITATMN